MKQSTLFLWILLLLVIWGLWLYHLDARDLSFDEVATWYIAHRPLPEMFQYLREAIYEHPPVYYTLIHFWMKATGAGEFTLRLFSVMTALVALPLLGWAVRRTPIGAMGGWIPALLLAAMPGLVSYARNARMYALGVVWVALSSGIFLRNWLHARSWPRWQAILLLGTVHLMALFTHYYLLLPIIVQPVALLLLRRWRPLAAWLALHALLAFSGLLWLAVSPGLQASAGGFRLVFYVPPTHDVAQLLRLLIFSREVRPPFPTLYAFLALAGFALLLALLRKSSRAMALWLVCFLFLPLALAYQLPKVPVERYILFLLLPLAWALSFLPALAFRLPRLQRSVAVLFSLALAGNLSANGLSHVLNQREGGYGHILRQVQQCAQPEDGILFYGPWQWLLFRYYDPGGLPPIATLPPQAPPRLSPEEARPVLEDLLRRYHRLWVLPASVGDVDPDHFVEGWMNTHAHPVWRTGDFTLYLPPLPSDGPSRPIGAVFGETLRLEKVEWEAAALPAGHPLRFTLHWVSLRPLPGDVRVSLMLRDTSGNTWDDAYVIPGEWAYPPSRWQRGDRISDRQGLMIPPGAPPGEYTVYLTVADEQTREVLTTPEGPEISLFSLRVEEPSPEDARKALACAFPEPAPTLFCSPDGTSCLSLVAGGSPQQVYPGYPVPVTLHWTTSAEALPDVRVRVEAVSWRNALGTVSPISVTLLVIPDYPSSRWLPGRIVTQKLLFPLPVEIPAGSAWLRLGVIGPDGVPWRTSSGEQTLSLSRLTVQRRPVLRYLPLGVRRIRVAFGDSLELRGYRMEGEPRPGGTLYVTYFWYARARPRTAYAVFNHLLTADGILVAQKDSWPREGNWPTTHWLPGDYVEDRYVLSIPADAPPGPYRFSVGMYDVKTGERLPAIQNG
ncbi:MAG: hypothetical protein D6793_10455, partial [Thermoflexia bacterium]